MSVVYKNNWEKDGNDRGLLRQIPNNLLGWLRANHNHLAQDIRRLDENRMELRQKPAIGYTETITYLLHGAESFLRS